MKVGQSDGTIRDEFAQAGSSAFQSYPAITATTTVQRVSFGYNMNNIMVTNDGTDDVKIGLQGNSPLGLINDNLDTTTWTYIGTWASDVSAGLHVVGPDSTSTNTPGSRALYRPNKLGYQIAVSMVKGSATGIAQIELSTDGVTWVNPSTIAGIIRSDGATGAVLDTFDPYVSGSAIIYDLLYTLPNFANWSMRVSYTGNKNASSTGVTIWIDSGKVFNATSLTVKSKETQSYSIRTSDIQYVSNSGSQPIRLVVTS